MRLGWRTLLDPVQFLALGAGAGLAPRAPGTFGTLLALVPAWGLYELPFAWRCAVVAAAAALGVAICGAGARRLGVHDHPGIVFDEIVGLLATTLAAPARSLVSLALAFVLFRFFDILKPWPIRDVDHRVEGGTGIMLDDLIAAAYAAVCLIAIRHWLPID
jgi:phosphatidylglycerophosphatase A